MSLKFFRLALAGLLGVLLGAPLGAPNGVPLAWAGTPEASKVPAWPAAGALPEAAFFQPTAEESGAFEAASALAGGPVDFWAIRQGPAIYRAAPERPLEIHWTRRPAAGGPGVPAEGYGEMTLRYAGDRMVLERYRGEFKNGFREGRGELLAREIYGDDAFFYRGDFRHGRLEGRGVYINADFHQRGEAPFIYEGEFLNDAFHGQGVMTDLSSGRVIYQGLWFEGSHFAGGPAKWSQANRRSGLSTLLAEGRPTGLPPAESTGGQE